MTVTRGSVSRADDAVASAVFLDFDTVLLATFPGRRGVELGLQADLPQSLDRLCEIAEHVIVLVDPVAAESGHGLETEHRVDVLRNGIGRQFDELTVVTCPHGVHAGCSCAKPEPGLIELALREHGLRRRGGWHIGADQAGVQAGRAAGLRTIRVGPVGEDHLSVVHRADYEARDLLDAANRIMLESLTV